MKPSSAQADQWFAIVPSAELCRPHIHRARLLGVELAVWREAAGAARVWEDRCPHRGTRFSLGRHLGAELACRYHGWRFAADGRCTRVPAHPAMLPPEALRARTYPVDEAHGFVWSSLGTPARAPAPPKGDGQGRTIRSIVVHAPAHEVAAALEGFDDGVTLLYLPADTHKTVVHGILHGPGQSDALRRCNERLCAVRDGLESRGTAAA